MKENYTALASPLTLMNSRKTIVAFKQIPHGFDLIKLVQLKRQRNEEEEKDEAFTQTQSHEENGTSIQAKPVEQTKHALFISDS